MAQYSYRDDIYTGAANGVTVNLVQSPKCKFSIAVKGTGAAPTSFNVLLEGSLDNANWTTILTATEATPGDGKIQFQAAGVLNPVRYMRSRCTAVVLGGASNIVVKILGMD